MNDTDLLRTISKRKTFRTYSSEEQKTIDRLAQQGLVVEVKWSTYSITDAGRATLTSSLTLG